MLALDVLSTTHVFSSKAKLHSLGVGSNAVRENFNFCIAMVLKLMMDIMIWRALIFVKFTNLSWWTDYEVILKWKWILDNVMEVQPGNENSLVRDYL